MHGTRLVVALATVGLVLAARLAEAAPFALVGSTLDETITVIDTATTPTATATISLSGTPSGVSVNPVRREAYVGALNADAAAVLLVLSTDLLEQVTEIPLSVLEPTDVAVNAAGTRAYVTGGFSDNLVSVVNLDTRAEIATIAVGPAGTPPGPVGVVAHPSLARLYVVNSNSGTVSVIATGTNTVVATITLTPCPLGCAPLEAALTPAGGLLFVTDFFADSVWVINTTTNTIVRSVALPFGAQPEGIGAHPDGTRVYVAHLDVAGGGMLTAISTAGTNPILGNVSVGANPLGVAVHPSGAAVYVVNERDDTVTVAATANLADQVVVPVGASPSTVGRFITPPPAPPTLASFTPPSGAVGTQVTITGTNLLDANVTFTGPVTVTPTAVTATSLKATVPAGALTGPISVSSAGTATSATAFKVLPQITGFSPTSAVAGSGTVVVVSGNNLRAGPGNPVVKIGAVTVASLNASSVTEVRFTVPLGAVTAKISVTTLDGTATATSELIVIQPPKITGITPAAAAVGATLTIAGTNLLGVTDVTFTGPVTVTPTAVTATSVKAVVPVGALTGPVSVTNAAGTGVSATALKVMPRITGFTPASVVAGSDTPVVVTGNNLRAATGEPAVKIGTIPVPFARVLSSTATELRFTVPLGAVTGRINITTIDGLGTSAVSLTVLQPPRVTSFTPATGPVGISVTVAGAFLDGATAVTFTGPITVTPTAVTGTSVTAVVPAGALTGPVSVTNSLGTGTGTAVFKVAPRITGFTPPSAVAGSSTLVTVTGNNLRAATGNPVVKIGAFRVPSLNASSLTELQFTVPLGAVTGKISVTTLDGTAITSTGLVVIQPPRITGLTPPAAPVGATLAIAGTSLLGVTSVTFTGPVTVTPTAVTATSVKAVVPVGALTGPVSVTNAVGTGVSTAALKLIPSITGFTPGSAVAGSETPIVVTGNNLRAASGEPVVKIGTFTVPANRVLSSTPTELQFRIPLGAVTGKISITTLDGVGTSVANLTVIQPPKVTSFTPATGPVGTAVTIAGMFLDGATAVTFTGPVTVTPTAVTPTSLKVVVPTNALTGVVSVTNPVGTGTSTAIFKVAPRITGFSPPSALPGAIVTISGFNLRAASGEPVVKFGTLTVPSLNASTLTEVRVAVPATALTGKLSVTTVDGVATSATNFRVIKPPTVTAFTPASGPVGTAVTITGTNFLDATEVVFNGVSPGAPTILSATSLRVTVPSGATSGKISVTNPAGSAQSTGTFTVTP